MLARKYETEYDLPPNERIVKRRRRAKRKMKFGPMVSWTIIASMFFALVIGYVAIHASMAKTAFEINNLRKEKNILENQNAHLNVKIMHSSSLDRIEKIARAKLHMVEPKEVQYIALRKEEPTSADIYKSGEGLRGKISGLYNYYIGNELK